MRSIELRQKILLIRLAGQLLLLNGNQTKERVFLSKLLRIILSGISLANYINGSQIHMLSCHCKNWKTDWMRISTLFMQWLILWVMKNYLNHIWENGLTKQLKQLSGKYTNSYMLIQLLRSEPLEPRLENGKRLHYNFKFGELRKSGFIKLLILKISLKNYWLLRNVIVYDMFIERRKWQWWQWMR